MNRTQAIQSGCSGIANLEGAFLAKRVSRRLLDRVRVAAERNYGRYPNVVAVAVGTKFVKGRPTDESASVLFLVSRKFRSGGAIRRRLPSFVYRRRRDGSVDRSARFPTDVIPVGRPGLACSGGSSLAAPGQTGAATLFFSGTDGRYRLLTCAHVVGDLADPRPTGVTLEADCCREARPFARVRVSAVQDGDTVDFDIALAELTELAAAGCEVLERAAVDSPAFLARFLPTEEIEPGLGVECRLPASRLTDATVRAYPADVRLELDGREVTFRNACAIDAGVLPGDSGGLLFRGDAAVGIVFARSTGGWGWFHPLAPAVRHLQAIAPELQLAVF